MRTIFINVLAAAVLANGISVTVFAQQNDKTPLPLSGISADSGEKLRQLGSQPADEKAVGEVREMLAQVINDEMTEGKFMDLLTHLAIADRTRIDSMPRENFNDLHAVIAQFRQDFRGKYNAEFGFKSDYLKNAEVNQGVEKETALVLLFDPGRNLPVKPAPGATPALQKPNGEMMDPPKGISMAAGPALNLVKETQNAAAWKINIPNEIGGRQLKENLTRHLKKIEDQKAVWPADAGAMYHTVAWEMLQAMTDSSVATEQ